MSTFSKLNTIATFAALATLAALAMTSNTASADDRGAVLKLEDDTVYVDLGTDAGVSVGSLLTLYHVISVKHPVSGKPVRDSFPLAKLRVINAGAKISVAVVPGPFRKRVVVGDEITLASEPVTVVDPWTQPGGGGGGLADPYEPAADPRGPAALAARKREIAVAERRLALVAAIEATWAATLGKAPARRVEIWREYLRANPETPYRATVGRAIAELEAFIASSVEPGAQDRGAAIARARTDTLGRLVGGFRGDAELVHQPPTRIDEGTPLDLAFLAVAPADIASAWLYYRRSGDDAFLRVELTADGDSYLLGEVPAAAVRPPGVEYFIETLSVAEGARPRAVIGSDKNPTRVTVEAAAEPTPIDQRGRSRVTLTLDYVDFDGVGGKNKFDQYWLGEIDFQYRFRKRGIYALRLGFGTLNGTGGPKDVIDADPTDGCLENGEYRCRDVAYNYAYTELEWRVSDYIGIMIRPQWGSAYRDNTNNAATANADREFFDAFGLRGRLRFGREDGSNLVLGASATQELGRLFEAGFTWDVLEEVPLVFSVHVTDQPVIEDFGVRLIADIGLRKLSWVYPSLRIAYQARDIDHAGLSAGMAANFDW